MSVSRTVLYSLIATSALVCGTQANAVDFENTFNVGDANFQITSGTPTSPAITAAFFNGFGSSGTFQDTFLFTIPQTGLGSGNLSTSFTGMSTMLTISDVIINGTSYGAPTPTGSGQFFTVNDLPLTAFFQNSLTVVGTISGSGTYSGNLTFQATPAAVPEPATWAMFIGGFGLIGGAMRRRQRVSVRFA
jgi:hypothetical protein